MIRLVTRGRLSQNYAKGFLAAPEDREPAVRKLIEAAGGNIAFVIVLVDREEGGRENIEQRGHTVVPIFTRADLIGTDAGRRSHIAVA